MKSFTSRERFLTALRKEIPDRVPIFEFPFGQELQKEFIGYSTRLYDGKAAVKIANKLGIDGVPVFLGGYCGVQFFETDEDIYTDDWGIVYEAKGWPITSQIRNPIATRKDWESYDMSDPEEEWRFRQLHDAVKTNTSDKAIICCIRGPVSVLAWFLSSIDRLSFNFIDDPELVHDMCNSFIDWSIVNVKKAAEIGGFDAFLIADDWGMTKSLLISPEYLRQFFFQPYKRLVDAVKELGYPVIMHNDGNIWEVLDDISGMGVDAYHPVEKAATMDLGVIKAKYKGILCPIGNIDNKKVLVSGTIDDVREETMRCLRDGSEGGGYIISSDHSLHDDMPVENITTYIDTVMKYGKYHGDRLELS